MRIGIVAGESSGDLLGSQLIKALLPHCPGAQFVGIAGPRMQSAGALSWFPMEKLAVRGYVEVLRHFPEIFAIRRKLARRLIALTGEDADVEGRIVRPRTNDAMVEIQSVHLGPQDLPVHVLVHGPAVGLDCGEAPLIRGKLALLGGHRGCRVIGHAVHELRMLEGAPVREQRDEIGVRGALRPRARARGQAEGDQSDCGDGPGPFHVRIIT
jgi:hypothetical protein